MASIGTKATFTNATTMLSVLVLALVSVCGWCPLLEVRACGIATHTEIAHRAMQFDALPAEYDYYQQLTEKYQHAFEAGNPYPDAMYDPLCYHGVFHSVAEDSHWSPFQNATFNYIRQKYPKPWDEATEMLVAFSLGFVSHQVADVLWHSLGIQQGFLSTMGYIDFYGSYDNAHSVVDPGGDVMAFFELDMSYIGARDWYIPTKDLVNIYTEYYGKEVVNSTVIEYCTTLLYLGRVGEKLVFAEDYRGFADKSEFLAESFYDYFLGGVDDMAAWTVLSWEKAIYMIEQGTQACNINENPLYISCPGAPAPKALSSGLNPSSAALKSVPPSTAYRNKKLAQLGLGMNDIVVTRTERGTYLSPSENLKKRLIEAENKKQSKKQPPLADIHSEAHLGDDDEGFNLNATYSTDVDYSRLGWDITSGDFNADGYADVVMSAPGYDSSLGRVFILYGGEGVELQSQTLGNSSDYYLQGLSPYSRFGTAVGVLDWNCDSIDDLVVSAPSFGTSTLNYLGQVYVYLGAKGTGLGSGPDRTPDFVMQGADTYANIGLKIATGDIDSDSYPDLVIGSRYAGYSQTGMVQVYLSSSFCNAAANASKADWTAVGENQYDWFGDFISVEQLNDTQTTLLIGAPKFRTTDGSTTLQNVGKLYAYDVLTGNAIFAITGALAEAKFGFQADIGSPFGDDGPRVLAVSATGQNTTGKILFDHSNINQAGAVFLYDLASLSGDLLASDLTEVVKFSGDRLFGRFGWQIGFVGPEDDFYISAPFRSEDLSDVILPSDFAEEGALYVFEGGEDFPKSGDPTLECGIDPSPCPAKAASYYFKSPSSRSRFGFRVYGDIDFRDDNEYDLLVSAVLDSSTSREGGIVEALCQ